jgi:hypothetical protein
MLFRMKKSKSYNIHNIFFTFVEPYVKTTTKPGTKPSKNVTTPITDRPWTDRLTCFTCSARNMDECIRTGYYKECDYNEQSCMIEARHRGGRTENVSYL